MNYRVFIRSAAITDLQEVRDWYQIQRIGLGEEFLLSIAATLFQIEESPLRYPLYYRDFRRVLVQRFPYKIFFRIEADSVIVFRVLHAARDHVGRIR